MRSDLNSLSEEDKNFLKEFTTDDLADYINKNLERDNVNESAKRLSKIIKNGYIYEDVVLSSKTHNIPQEMRKEIGLDGKYDDERDKKELLKKIKRVKNKKCNIKTFISSSYDGCKGIGNSVFGSIRYDINVKRGTNGILLEDISTQKQEKEILLDRGHTLVFYDAYYDKEQNNLVLKFNLIK